MLHRLSILLCLAFLCPLARAADPSADWTLTTADLTAHPADWAGLSEQGVQVRQNGATRTVPWEDFVAIGQSPASPTTQPAGLSLALTNGDRLTGEPAGMSGETLAWTSPDLGKLTLPLRRIEGIYRGAPPSDAAPAPAEDQAQLNNGDVVKGIVADLTPQTLTMQVNGQAAQIPLSSLHRLQLAATGEAKPAAARALRLTFADGSIFTVSAARSQGKTLQLTLDDGAEHRVQAAALVSIEQVNGPVVWLSSLKPAEAVQTPDFDLSWPARMNQSVTGGPIRFGNRTYDQGIGVHAYARLRFDLPPGYRLFRTQYAIDGNGALADVTVRIYLDQKRVYERTGVKAGWLSPVVELPLGQAKTLTLEVDDGANGAVQDRFNWIAPALLKTQLPASQPGAQ